MDLHEIRRRLEAAMQKLLESDRYLLEQDLNERCIAARLAMYLQPRFPQHNVDVEYNRAGITPKRLALSEVCAARLNSEGKALVIPDVIVHRRGTNKKNLLLLELKKTTRHSPDKCDAERLRAFMGEFGYRCCALLQCETRSGERPQVALIEWLTNRDTP